MEFLGRTALYFALTLCACAPEPPLADIPWPVSACLSAPGGGDPSPVSFPDTTRNIHPFLTFDYEIVPYRSFEIAGRYDFVWGSYHPAPPADRGAPQLLSHYMPFFFDPDSAHDLAWWNAFHPDWVLYQCDRKTLAFRGASNVPIDITNPDVIAWQVAFAREGSEGFDAIAADILTLTPPAQGPACGVFRDGKWVELFGIEDQDPRWVEAVIGWAREFRRQLHALPHPLALVGNYTVHTDAANSLRLAAELDAILDEEGFYGLDLTPLQPEAWKRKIEAMRCLQASGKPVLTITQTAPDDPAATRFALASYLIGKDAGAYVWTAPGKAYGTEAWHPEYSTPIGEPCGIPRASGGAFVRDYSRGEVLVNPGPVLTHPTLPGRRLHDLDGEPFNPSDGVPARGAAILLADEDRCP